MEYIDEQINNKKVDGLNGICIVLFRFFVVFTTVFSDCFDLCNLKEEKEIMFRFHSKATQD